MANIAQLSVQLLDATNEKFSQIKNFLQMNTFAGFTWDIGIDNEQSEPQPRKNLFVSIMMDFPFSHNQIQVLPVHICSLPLKVLIVNQNRLQAIPSEIGLLGKLQQLVSATASQLFYDKEYLSKRAQIDNFFNCFRKNSYDESFSFQEVNTLL